MADETTASSRAGPVAGDGRPDAQPTGAPEGDGQRPAGGPRFQFGSMGRDDDGGDGAIGALATEAPEHLAPPTAGHRIAGWWAWSGVAVFLVLLGAFLYTMQTRGRMEIAELFGLGDSLNPAMVVIVFGALLLTLAVMHHVVDREIAMIRREELDIQWLIDGGRKWRSLVLADPKLREQLKRDGVIDVPPGNRVGVETLVDLAVYRVEVAERSGRMPTISPGSLREIAEKRTARLGSFARYTSTLLLFLAVLGTFTGVKTALPGLIQAMSETGTGAPGATTPDGPAPGQPGQPPRLEDSLRAVADAFGANALALIGAISIGLMAHGVTIGRRHLIERLELVASAHIFGTESGGAEDHLSHAVVELSRAARQMEDSSAHLAGIEGGLVTLGNQFHDSFHQLETQLTGIMNREQSSLYEKTAQSMQELQVSVSNLVHRVSDNAQIYGSLVEGIGERARHSDEAVRAMRDSSDKLTHALDRALHMGDKSSETFARLAQATDALQRSSALIREQVETLTQAVATVEPAMTAVGEQIDRTTVRLSEVEAGSLRAWHALEAGLTRLSVQLSDEFRQMQEQARADQAQQIETLADTISRALGVRAAGQVGYGAVLPAGTPAGLAEHLEHQSRVLTSISTTLRRGMSPAALLRNGLIVGGGVLGALILFDLFGRLVTWLF